MTRILAFAGAKQSGKNTCCSFLHGYQMRSHRIIKDFSISDKGELVVGTVGQDVDGNDTENKGVLDVTRDDMEFAGWAAYNMWPFHQALCVCFNFKRTGYRAFWVNQRAVLWNRRSEKHPNLDAVGEYARIRWRQGG